MSFILVLALVGCSAVESVVDGIDHVYQCETEIPPSYDIGCWCPEPAVP